MATLRELPVTDRQCEEFRRTCIETAGCYKSPREAKAELAALEDKLLLEARPVLLVQSEKTAKVASIGRKSAAQSSIWNRAGGKG